jgi:hypothetical protein
MAPITSLYVVNKSGSLIYYREFIKRSGLTDNDHIRLASTFFSINQMAIKSGPCKSNGIQCLRSSTVVVQCLTSLTGMSFFAIAPAGGSQRRLEALLRQIYALYTDYVLKNPFYELDQAVRSQGRGALFDKEIDRLLRG